MTQTYPKEDPVSDLLAVLAEGQTCHYCGRPLADHDLTKLGAVICLQEAIRTCRPRWDQHRLLDREGQPYLSIMEQIGQLAGLIEERGLPDAYEPALENIRRLVARLAGWPPESVRPYPEWFVSAPPIPGAAADGPAA
jgi:hypothetical protein